MSKMAGDLEEYLGNHYSLMTKEFQQAYIKLIYFHLRKSKNNMSDLINNKDIVYMQRIKLIQLG